MPFFDPIRLGASGAGAADFTVDRSLRFNDDDDTYLQRTVSSTSNRKTFTISAWVKRSTLGSRLIFGQTDTSGNDMFYLVFDSNDKLYGLDYDYPTNNFQFITTQVFRDVSAWYHIVLAVDTTQSTNTDRWKLYVNGSQVTAFDSATYPTQNLDTWVNHTTYPVRLGKTGWNGAKYDGYMAEYNFVDGLAYDPSSFGETNVLTGQWNPKQYAGSYGTNGFYLKFADNSGTTATTLGKDSSGNGNNFTPNNFSVSAGTGNDSVEDTPTNNFPTFNPLNSVKYSNNYSVTIEQGNLLMRGGDNYVATTFLLPKSGKWYVEFSKYGNGAVQAISVTRANKDISGYDGALGLADMVQYVSNGELGNRSRGSTSNATAWSNDADIVVAIAIDMDNGAVYFARANTWQNSGDPTSGSSKTGAMGTDIKTDNNGDHVIAAQGYNGSDSYGMYVNFGQRAFTYTPPTGYEKLSSANLSDPTILLPNKHFDNLLWTGNGSDGHAITGLDFQPDWVWIKSRSVGVAHFIVDSLRMSGTDHYKLNSGANSAESDGSTRFTSIDSNGFTLPSGGTFTNGNGSTYVGWNWNAGDTDGKTYTVTVVSDSGNKYRFDGFGTSAVTLDLAEGGTYIFNYPSAHPFRFSTTSDGTHGGGSEYTTGVTVLSSTSVQIVVAASAPQLYYFCTIHSGMGGAINTNSSLGSSNFDGTIQSVAKVNALAGFSILKYTGTGSAGTIGHGLGVKPDVMITKRRDGSGEWTIYHKDLDHASSTSHRVIRLNTTAAQTGSSTAYYGNDPTSTVQHLAAYTDSNGSNETYVAYVFSGVAGYSKFGSYTGNGNADGTFVFTGFRPALIILKATNSARNWVLMDNKRSAVSGANQNDYTLEANNSNTENTAGAVGSIDMLSNGFKFRGSAADSNGSGNTYIYLAFAEAPFKNSRAR